MISGPVGFVGKFARVVGPSLVGGGPFVRNLSSFCQDFCVRCSRLLVARKDCLNGEARPCDLLSPVNAALRHQPARDAGASGGGSVRLQSVE